MHRWLNRDDLKSTPVRQRKRKLA
ncbi:hypothetical protein [Parathermosynechococcus lividus]